MTTTHDASDSLRAQIAALRHQLAEAGQQSVSGAAAAFSAMPAWYASVIECSNDAIFATDTAGKICAANPACVHLSGYELAELLGRPWESLCAPEELERTREYFLRGVAGAAEEFETVLVRKDGRRADLAVTGGPIVEGDGRISGVFVMARNIGPRKEMEREMRELYAEMERAVQQRTADLHASNAMLQQRIAERDVAEDRLRHVTAHARCILWYGTIEGQPGWQDNIDGEGSLFEWNIDVLDVAAAQRVVPLEVPPGQTYLSAWFAARNDEDRRSANRTSAAALITGQGSYQQEFRVTDRNGKVRWMLEDVVLEKAGEASWRVVGVCADVSERKQAEAVLQRSHAMLEARVAERTAALEAASKAKDHFLASLSHELRTPLTPVLLAARDLESRSPEPVRADMVMIRRNIELMTRLIDDLLDLTRVSRGKLVLHREAADAHAAVDSALGICAADARAKGVSLLCELRADATTLDADPARLRQALWNLVSNAIKFTPAGGSVTVRTRNLVSTVPGRRVLVIEVADTGIGIEPGDTARIFFPFEQADAAVTKRYGGLGLGLAITRAIVVLHGGTIAAESAGHGLGSTFRIELPVVPGSVPTLPAQRDDDGAGGRRKALEILLVEDHPDTCRVLRRLLESAGHKVTTASCVRQLAEVVSRKFDLLISDIGLPDGSGLDVVRQMRGQVLRAVALSGYGMAEDIERSREAGFDEHLTKPIDFGRLEMIVREMSLVTPEAGRAASAT